MKTSDKLRQFLDELQEAELNEEDMEELDFEPVENMDDEPEEEAEEKTEEEQAQEALQARLTEGNLEDVEVVSAQKEVDHWTFELKDPEGNMSLLKLGIVEEEDEETGEMVKRIVMEVEDGVEVELPEDVLDIIQTVVDEETEEENVDATYLDWIEGEVIANIAQALLEQEDDEEVEGEQEEEMEESLEQESIEEDIADLEEEIVTMPVGGKYNKEEEMKKRKRLAELGVKAVRGSKLTEEERQEVKTIWSELNPELEESNSVKTFIDMITSDKVEEASGLEKVSCEMCGEEEYDTGAQGGAWLRDKETGETAYYCEGCKDSALLEDDMLELEESKVEEQALQEMSPQEEKRYDTLFWKDLLSRLSKDEREELQLLMDKRDAEEDETLAREGGLSSDEEEELEEANLGSLNFNKSLVYNLENINKMNQVDKILSLEELISRIKGLPEGHGWKKYLSKLEGKLAAEKRTDEALGKGEDLNEEELAFYNEITDWLAKRKLSVYNITVSTSTKQSSKGKLVADIEIISDEDAEGLPVDEATGFLIWKDQFDEGDMRLHENDIKRLQGRLKGLKESKFTDEQQDETFTLYIVRGEKVEEIDAADLARMQEEDRQDYETWDEHTEPAVLAKNKEHALELAQRLKQSRAFYTVENIEGNDVLVIKDTPQQGRESDRYIEPEEFDYKEYEMDMTEEE